MLVCDVTDVIHLVIFDGIVAETLPLSEALWNLTGVTIQVDTSENRKVLVDLREELRAVHVGLPCMTT